MEIAMLLEDVPVILAGEIAIMIIPVNVICLQVIAAEEAVSLFLEFYASQILTILIL